MTSILMRRIVAMTLTGLPLVLAGCGYKGPLYLPPPPAAKSTTQANPPSSSPTTSPGVNPLTPGMPDTSNPASPLFEQDPSLTPAPIVISN